jgi:type II secretory pathway pseudopilin PulG
MKLANSAGGFKLIELMFSIVLITVLGLLIYSLLNISTVLGAKNTAVNTAHQQARVAMLQMMQDLHSAISLPALADSTGTAYPSPAPANAEGIAFQQWGSTQATVGGVTSTFSNGGPHKIIRDADAGSDQINISVTPATGYTTGQTKPKVGQRIIIPTHQIEADITAVSGPANDLDITLANIYGPAKTPTVTYPVNTLPIDVHGTGSGVGDVVCYVTERAWYAVSTNALNLLARGVQRTMVTDITSATPFNTPITPAGALYYRFVAAIDLSTADLQYNNRGYKSANVLLNGQVPYKVRLTTYQ